MYAIMHIYYVHSNVYKAPKYVLRSYSFLFNANTEIAK